MEPRELAQDAIDDAKLIDGTELYWWRDVKAQAQRAEPLAHAYLTALDENERIKKGYSKELQNIGDELSPALGYPYEEGYGWVTGDHTKTSLAMEARERIEELEKENDEMHNAFQVSARRRIELEGALRFYADEGNYVKRAYFKVGAVPIDEGARARAALKEEE
jgi:hypothetical protein